MGDYRKLDVWRDACTLSDRVDELVERLPLRVRSKKGDQVSRAADAIHENIAEGCGLNTDPQLSRHLKIALGSANEVEDELAALARRGYLADKDSDLIPKYRRLCAMLAKFIERVDPGSLNGRRRREPTEPA